MHCTVDDCTNEATTRFAWPWGESGLACDSHRSHLESLAKQVGRDPSFAALREPEPAKPEPSILDLIAQLRAANNEIEVLKARLELERVESVRLSNELGALRRRAAHHEFVDHHDILKP